MTEDAVLYHQWGYQEGGRVTYELARNNEPDENVRRQNTNHVLSLNDDGTVTMTSYLLALPLDGAPEGVHAPVVIAHGLDTRRLRKEGDRGR